MMIQLIGFLLCVYMLVRGLDIRSRVEDRKSAGSVSGARWASNIAFIGAVLFFILFIVQGSSTPTPPSSPF
jgi:putative copper export protein